MALKRAGLYGQMHGAVLLDTWDAVLRRAILWNDGRAQVECAELEAAQRNSGAADQPQCHRIVS